MKRRLLAAALAAMASSASADKVFTLKDYLHHTWSSECVSFDVRSREIPKSAALFGPDGQAVPVQISGAKDGMARVTFVVPELPADGEAAFTLKSGEGPKGVLAREDGGTLLLDSGTVAARVPSAGDKRFDPPVPLDQAAPPILAVRGPAGTWIGKGRMGGTVGVRSVRTTIAADGPVYAEVHREYELTCGRYWADVRVVRGQNAILVTEEFNTETGAVNNARFEFSLKEGLNPQRAAVHGRLWRERREKKETPAGTDYALDFDADRQEASVIGYVCWWPETVRVLTLHSPQASDALSFFPCRIGQWRNPMGSYLETRKSGEIFLSLPLYVDQNWNRDGMDRTSAYYTGLLEKGWPATASRRLWAFYLDARDRAVPASGRSSVAEAVIRCSDLPLDKIKDWIFEWKGAESVTYPRLYVKDGELEAVRQRILGTPGWDATLGRYDVRPETYLVKPAPKVGDELLHSHENDAGSFAVWGAVPALRQYVSMLFDGWGYVGFPAPNQARPMIEFVRFDAAMSVKEATEAEKRDMRQLAAFLAQMVYDDDWHPTLAGWHRGNPNMPPRQEHHLAVASAALPTHALAGQWAARGKAEQERELRDMVRPSGAWRECPHYQWEAAMYPMFQAAVPLRLAGRSDVFADPRLKKTWDYLLNVLTPPSPRFQSNGKRLRELPAFGNGSWEFVPLFGWLGTLDRDQDRAFSQRMMWAWNEQGRPLGVKMSEFVIDPNVPAAQPDLKSVHYDGFGSIMRSGFPSEDETWMAFRHGECMEHYNYGDQGSFMLYAKGSPLVLHFGSQYTPYFQGAWCFNRACVNHRLLTADDPPAKALGDKFADFAAGTELWAEDGSSDYVMHNKAFASFAAADFSRAEQVQKLQGVIGKDYNVKLPPNTPLLKLEIPEHRWVRRVLFLKDPDPAAPNYFLIRDDFSSAQPLPGEWNIWTLAAQVDVQGNPARVTGRYGTDLDVFMSEPLAPAWTTCQDTNRFLPGGSQHYLVEKPWTEVLTNLRCRQPGGKGFLAVLYPRKRAEAAAKCESIAGGAGVKVVTPRGTDWAFLSEKPVQWEGEGLRFSGTAGAIRQVGRNYEVVFAEPGQATVAGRTLAADKPMQRIVAAK